MSGNIRLRTSCDLWEDGNVLHVLNWQHTLTCELRLGLSEDYDTLLCLATYAYVRIATQIVVGNAVGRAGNIRLRASCDANYVVLYQMLCLTGNIRLRASCDL